MSDDKPVLVESPTQAGRTARPVRGADIQPFPTLWKNTVADCLDEKDLKAVFRDRLNENMGLWVNMAAGGNEIVAAVYEWAVKTGRLYELTSAAADYYTNVLHGKKAGLAELARSLQSAATPDAPISPKAPALAGLPPALERLIREYDAIPRRHAEADRPRRMKEKAAAIRDMPLTAHDLPGRFHLSDSPGARLAAILSLEQQTNPTYLRWLAERVCVEVGAAAQAAALALTYAALGLDRTAQPAFRAVLLEAIGLVSRLKSGAELQGQLLDDALKILDYRDGATPKPWAIEYDELAGALAAALTKDVLTELLWVELQTKLDRIANPDYRFEYVIFRTLRMANDNGWDIELIEKVKSTCPGNKRLAEACEQYLSAEPLTV